MTNQAQPSTLDVRAVPIIETPSKTRAAQFPTRIELYPSPTRTLWGWASYHLGEYVASCVSFEKIDAEHEARKSLAALIRN